MGEPELIDLGSPELTSIRNIVQILTDEGFTLCLVGGASRDYLAEKKISEDWDFEVHQESESNLVKSYQKLVSILSKQFKIEELPYYIIRFDLDGKSIELAFPRTEDFPHNQPILAHKDFYATCFSHCLYDQSFMRRDFTVNAIGQAFDKSNPLKAALIDPYNGMKDLKERKLRAISENFYKDPVRFLRLIRMQLDLKYEIDIHLKNNLNLFHLELLSVHYFLQELLASQSPLLFIKMFFQIVKDHHISVNHNLHDLLESFNSNIEIKMNPGNSLESVFSWARRLFPMTSIESWGEFLGVSPVLIKEVRFVVEHDHWGSLLNKKMAWPESEIMTVLASEELECFSQWLKTASKILNANFDKEDYLDCPNLFKLYQTNASKIVLPSYEILEKRITQKIPEKLRKMAQVYLWLLNR